MMAGHKLIVSYLIYRVVNFYLGLILFYSFHENLAVYLIWIAAKDVLIVFEVCFFGGVVYAVF